jgi:hypothetical protein
VFHRRYIAGALLACGGLIGAACDSPTTPTDETTTTTTTTISYSNQLSPGLFTWRSFQISKAGTVTLQLVSLSPDTEGVVGLGLGVFDGASTCTITTELATAPGTAPQISTELASGTYCVKVTELGTLSRTQDFVVSIVTPV